MSMPSSAYYGGGGVRDETFYQPPNQENRNLAGYNSIVIAPGKKRLAQTVSVPRDPGRAMAVIIHSRFGPTF